MSQRGFNKEIARLERRLRLLLAVDEGEVRLRTITCHRKVMTWTVKAKSRTYKRRVAPVGWEKKRR